MEQTSASFELISHPDRTLQEHLDSCNDISEKLLDMKFISSNFFPKPEIEDIRKLLVYFHDFGKGTDYFQSKIIEATIEEDNKPFIDANQDYINYFLINKNISATKELNQNPNLSNHAKLGAYFVFSNYSNINSIIEYIVLKVIRRHHGYLTNLIEDKNNNSQIFLDEESKMELDCQIDNLPFELYQNILLKTGFIIERKEWDNIKAKFGSLRQIEKNKNKLYQEKDSKYFFLQHYLFSLLLSADKGDMMIGKSGNKWNIILENQLFSTEMVGFYKQATLKNEGKAIDIDRECAYQDIAINTKKYASYNFFSITLPTGMGKTFSAYNAAIILQNEFVEKSEGKKPRIIYCLPFTSIIDQNSAIFSQIVASYKSIDSNLKADMVAKHHYLSIPTDSYNDIEIGSNEAEYLTEGWEQEFIVTTFVQFLESIFTNQNKALRKFNNMTNAIIVLDEVQNIPPKYYEAIELVFTKMAEYFNTKFIFVTATQPIIFSKTNVIELTDFSKERTKYYFEKLERIVIDQKILKESNYQPQDLKTELLSVFCDDIEENETKSFLFILNTIAQAQFIYTTFCELYGKESQIIYLSGSILPKRRKQLIQLIKRNIKYKKRQIVVSTQVVEAGVDIDLDIVYRDFAPLDSINQSAGRCNRNGLKGKGFVKLFNTGKYKHIYDGTLMNITEKIFKTESSNIEEKNIYQLSNRYFDEIQKCISDKSNSSKTLIDAIYHLELETVQKEFKIIKDENYYHNVFIPYNPDSKRLWEKYLELNQIEDFFKRKQLMKKLKPRLLQYVTRFPKNKYQLDSDQKENFIIYESNWQTYYDLNAGFRLNIDENVYMF